MHSLLFLAKQYFSIKSVISLLLVTIGMMSSNLSLADNNKCTEPLILGWDSWSPYQYLDADKQLTGLDIELINTIAKNAGCPIVYQNMPWKRTLNMIELGKIHLAAGASKTSDREAYAYFTDAYRSEQVALFVRQEDINKHKINSLKDILNFPFSIGIIDGVYYGELFEQLIQKNDFKKRIHIMRSNSYNAKMVARHHLDGMLGDPIPTKQQLIKLGYLDLIKRHPMPLIDTGDIHIMLSKKSTSINTVRLLNKSISELKENGGIEKIFSKYSYESSINKKESVDLAQQP